MAAYPTRRRRMREGPRQNGGLAWDFNRCLFDLAFEFAGVRRLPLSSVTTEHRYRYPEIRLRWQSDPRDIVIGDFTLHELATLTALLVHKRGFLGHELTDGSTIPGATRARLREYIAEHPELVAIADRIDEYELRESA